jgi:hypothetical protein
MFSMREAAEKRVVLGCTHCKECMNVQNRDCSTCPEQNKETNCKWCVKHEEIQCSNCLCITCCNCCDELACSIRATGPSCELVLRATQLAAALLAKLNKN